MYLYINWENYVIVEKLNIEISFNEHEIGTRDTKKHQIKKCYLFQILNYLADITDVSYLVHI